VLSGCHRRDPRKPSLIAVVVATSVSSASRNGRNESASSSRSGPQAIESATSLRVAHLLAASNAIGVGGDRG
jgi:hypothetical protein